MANKTNHPRKYVRWDDFEAWLLKEWFPFQESYKLFLTNDLPHLIKDVSNTKRDMTWVKILLGGMVLAVFTIAIAALTR